MTKPATGTSRSPMSTRRRDPRLLLIGLIALQALAVGLQPARHGGDDPIRVRMLQELADGHWPRGKFSTVMVLAAAPLAMLGKLGGVLELVADRWVQTLWVGWSIAVGLLLLQHRNVATVMTFQVFIFASMLTAYGMGFNAEVVSALGVSFGLFLALLGRQRRTRTLGWLVVAVAVANIPAQLPGLIGVAAFLALRRRRPAILIVCLPAVAIIVTEASLTRGTFAFSKYAGSEQGSWPLLPWGTVEGFGYPILFGLLGIIASFGRGLVFYLPLLVVALRRPRDRLSEWSWCLALFVMMLIPLYAKWWAWFGGVTFGPRFFLVGAVAGAFAAADALCNATPLSAARRAGIACLAAFSGWVAIAGVVWGITPKAAERCMGNDFFAEPMCWYAPEYSSLFAPLWEWPGLSWHDTVFIGVVTLMVAATLAPHVARSVRGVGSWLVLWSEDVAPSDNRVDTAHRSGSRR